MLKDTIELYVQRVRQALSKLGMPIDVQSIGVIDSLQNKHGIDSLMLMEFLVLLEEEFEIEFEDDFNNETLDSLQSIAEYILEKK